MMSKFVLIFLFAAVNTGLHASVFSVAEIPVHIYPANKWIIIDKSISKDPKLDVSIKRADGSVLISENIKYSKKYNLKNMPEGHYTLEIEDDQQIRIQNLQIANDMLYSTGITTVYKPRLILDPNHIDMNLMTQGQPAEISIRNADSNTVFSEKINGEVSVTRRYTINQLPQGAYFIEVEIAGQQFITSFSR